MNTKDEQSVGPADYLPNLGQTEVKRRCEGHEISRPDKVAKCNDTESKQPAPLVLCTPTEAMIQERNGILMVDDVIDFGVEYVDSPEATESKQDNERRMFKILVDQSGSMSAPNTGSDIRPIDLVKDTVRILTTRLSLEYPDSDIQFLQFSSDNQYEITIPWKDDQPDTSGIHSMGCCATDPSKVLDTLFANQKITVKTVIFLLTDNENVDAKPIRRYIQLPNGEIFWVPVVLLGFTSYTPFHDPNNHRHIQEAVMEQNGKDASQIGSDNCRSPTLSLFDAETAPGDTYSSSDGTDPLNPYVTLRVMPASMSEILNGFTPTTAVDSVMVYLLDWGKKYTKVTNKRYFGVFLRFGGLTLRLDADSSVIVPFDLFVRANFSQGNRALYFTY